MTHRTSTSSTTATRDRAGEDPLIAQSEAAELDADRARRAANLFDLRRMIGGLFGIYGVILTIMGITASQAQIDKAAGINLNLWVGLAMLFVAALFWTWALARPLGEQLEEDEEDAAAEERGEGRFRRDAEDRTVVGQTAPVGPDAAAIAHSGEPRRGAGSDRDRTGGDRRFGRE